MTKARRLLLAALSLAGAAVVGAVGVAGPAGAAGTGGVELTPVAPTPGTAFHLSARSGHPTVLAFELRNVGSAAADAHVYPAAVARNGTAYAVAGPGTAPWIALPDEVVHLEPGATRHVDVRVDPTRAPSGSLVYGAVVQETAGDVTVRARVATLVYLHRSGSAPSPRPLAWLALASLLAAATGGAAAAQARRHLVRARS